MLSVAERFCTHEPGKASQSSPQAVKDDSVAFVGTADGLSMVNMEVNGTSRCVKRDSCVRYTIAGTGKIAHDDDLAVTPPVDYVEAIGGFLLDVLGVWRFNLHTILDVLCRAFPRGFYLGRHYGGPATKARLGSLH